MLRKFFGQGIGHIEGTVSGWNSTNEAGRQVIGYGEGHLSGCHIASVP
jgi:hypothetical protein